MQVSMSRLILIPILLLVTGILCVQPVAAQGGGNRAALIVRDGDGSVQTKCISFSEPTISGKELLQRSGMTVVINPNLGSGGAVCSINGYGCAYPTADCFCKCQGAKCEYWAYYHWVGGAWQYSQVGATGYQVQNGALEGWSWGQGNFSSGTIPATVKFEDICTSPIPIPTIVVTRTSAPPTIPPLPIRTRTPAPPTIPPPIRTTPFSPTKQVGLVIGLPNGQEHLEIVTVPTSATTFDVLKAAKIALISQDMSLGPAVCSINGTGCPATNCFCDPARFWAYYHLDAASRTWAVAPEGVGAYVPAGGAVEGFAWSGFDANFNPTVKPPVYTFSEIVAKTAGSPNSVPEPLTVLLLGTGLAGLAGYARYARARRAAR